MAEQTNRALQKLATRLLATGAVLTGLSCGGGDVIAPTTGSLEITTATSGPEPDADGYAVSIDDGAETAVGANASLQRDNMEPGNHSVRLAGMAANCSVEDPNPRTVAVTGDAMAEVSFVITCRATTGSLEITSTTSGPSPDPDGYTIALDGSDAGTLGVSGAVTLDRLAPGSHVVGLSGIAANCQVQGDNPRAATVTAGASATVAFAIACAAPPPNTGTLRILTSTSGPEPDPDGYAFAVDDGASQPIGVSATASLANMPTGGHTVQLSGVARNCTIQGTNPRLVTIVAGATAEVSFAVTCTAATGRIEITTTTTGNAPDADGYTVAIDDAAAQTIGATATLTVSGVGPGAHRVTLAGLTWNCRVDGDNPRSVTVTAGAGTTVAFSLNCYAPLIAFTSNRDGNSAIYVMRADGGGQTKLTNGSSPAWSPDGTQIAFVRNADIYIMNADGSSERHLTNHPARDLSPTWSPDGTKIAFVRDADPEDYYFREIMVMNNDGSGVAQLAANGGYYTSVDWSRDGSRIAYSAWFEDVPSWIAFMNADGKGGGEIRYDLSVSDWAPTWSTGGRIVFSSEPHEFSEDGGNRYPEDNEIHVINPDGSGSIQLTNNSVDDLYPAWSRDDRKIAFASYRDGNSNIYVMNADGSGQTRLTNHPDQDSDPSWSP